MTGKRKEFYLWGDYHQVFLRHLYPCVEFWWMTFFTEPGNSYIRHTFWKSENVFLRRWWIAYRPSQNIILNLDETLTHSEMKRIVLGLPMNCRGRFRSCSIAHETTSTRRLMDAKIEVRLIGATKVHTEHTHVSLREGQQLLGNPVRNMKKSRRQTILTVLLFCLFKYLLFQCTQGKWH